MDDLGVPLFLETPTCRFCVFVWGVLIFVGRFCCGMCCVLLLAGDMYVLLGDVVLVGVLVPNTEQAKLFREQLSNEKNLVVYDI